MASCTEASSSRTEAKTERLDGDNGGTSVMCASVSSESPRMSSSTRCAQRAPKGGIVNSCGESVWCGGCALGLRVRAQLARGVAHAL